MLSLLQDSVGVGAPVAAHFIVILLLSRTVNFSPINTFSETRSSSSRSLVAKRILGFTDSGENSEKLVEVKSNNLKLLDGFKSVKSQFSLFSRNDCVFSLLFYKNMSNRAVLDKLIKKYSEIIPTVSEHQNYFIDGGVPCLSH